jgi:hypothetical protein
MTKVIRRSRQELLAETQTQLRFLLKSAKDFDEGDLSEAKRLATGLRVLLHQTTNSHSLLFQIGGSLWRFKDTSSPYNERNLVTHTGLVALQASGQGSRFKAMLSDRPRPPTNTTYSEWWGVTPVIVPQNKKKVTRKQIVCWLANQDGGAHVDPVIDPRYYGLTKGDAHGWRTSINGIETALPGLIEESVRQIAHEALLTFRRKTPQCFPENVYSKYDVI